MLATESRYRHYWTPTENEAGKSVHPDGAVLIYQVVRGLPFSESESCYLCQSNNGQLGDEVSNA